MVQPIRLDIADAVNDNLEEDQRISFDLYLFTDDGALDSVAATGGTDALPYQQTLENPRAAHSSRR